MTQMKYFPQEIEQSLSRWVVAEPERVRERGRKWKKGKIIWRHVLMQTFREPFVVAFCLIGSALIGSVLGTR